MATHPTGVCVDVVGILASDRGRSCEEHECCGKAVVEIDTVLRIRSIQIEVDGQEETALACYWVTDGIDRCRVGFLRRFALKHMKQYDGKLAQVVEVFGDNSESPSDKAKHHRNVGCCRAAIIDSVKPKRKPPASSSDGKKKAKGSDKEDT